MAKEKRLGRGLEALLNRVSSAAETADSFELPVNGAVAATASSVHVSPETEAKNGVVSDAIQSAAPQTPVSNESAAPEEQTETIHYLDINLIDANPYQPRIDFDSTAINELAQSLNEHGLLQPPVVRSAPNGRYQLVYGERRFRAALQVGWQQIPALVIQATDGEMATYSLVENVQRKELNAIEKALSVRHLLKTEKCTQETLAKRLCLDRSTIANLVRLLDLPEDLQNAIRQEKISAAHGRALLPLADAKLQRDFTDRIINEGLSAHQVEAMVREFLENESTEGGDVIPMPKPTRSAQLSELEKNMYSAMGMKVKLCQSAGGKGKITISFKNHEQFERLHNILMTGDYADVQDKKSTKKAA